MLTWDDMDAASMPYDEGPQLAEPSPGGLLMPNQPMMYAGRVFASTQLPAVMHIVRDLCGCRALRPAQAGG